MLPKSKRLNLKTQFKWVVAGKKTETSNFKFFWRIGNNNQALIGIALSKGQFHEAYQRNRARRITAQIMQIIYNELLNQLNLVIIPKAGVLIAPKELLLEEVKDVVGLYKLN